MLCATTSAPDTTPPLGSVTVPVTPPVTVCACGAGPHRSVTRASAIPEKCLRNFVLCTVFIWRTPGCMGGEKTCDGKRRLLCPGICLPRKGESDDWESIEMPANVCQQNSVTILKESIGYFQYVVRF